MTIRRRFGKLYLSTSLVLLSIPLALRAQAPVNVVFDELPGGVLNEYLNGSPIGNWVLQPPPLAGMEVWQDEAPGLLGNLSGSIAIGWDEPDHTGAFNAIDHAIVASDDPIFYAPFPALPDGAVGLYSVYGDLVVTAGGAVPANFTFNDLGDVSDPVPDNTPTLLLAVLACVALAIVRRSTALPAAPA